MNTGGDTIPVLNMDFALEQIMNDEEFLQELLEDALVEEKPRTDALLDGMDDASQMRNTSEYIQGYAANLGIEALRCEATALRSSYPHFSKMNLAPEQQSLLIQAVFHELWRFRRFMEKKFPSSDS
jgi:hypothetical protein